MKIFIDAEFYEHQPKAFVTRWVTDEADGSRGPSTGLEPLPGANAVQLISLGAVREDGAEFYAENIEFDWGNVPQDHWLWKNVKTHLSYSGGSSDLREATTVVHGPARIAEEFHKFAVPQVPTTVRVDSETEADLTYDPPEVWGYFCDYDWVALCGLFGRMVDLPPEFPMFCLDLKQEMHRLDLKRNALPAQNAQEHHALSDARWIRDAYLQMRIIATEDF